MPCLPPVVLINHVWQAKPLNKIPMLITLGLHLGKAPDYPLIGPRFRLKVQLDHISMPPANGVVKRHRPRFIARFENQAIAELSLFVVLRVSRVGKGWIPFQE